METRTLYEVIGEEKINQVVAKFYESIATDEVIRPMYPPDLEPAEERLRLFLIQVFGGPTTYSEQRGHPRLRRRHFPYPIDLDARNRWLLHMNQALQSVQLSPETMKEVTTYFERAATHMMNKF